MDKIDQENLDFLEEILERINRLDLIRDVLRPFQPPDRDIPENPELQPRSNDVGASKREAPKEERHTSGTEGEASGSTGDFIQGGINFGGKGSEPGKFRYPRGVLVSPSNEIFVADGGNRRVQVHSTEGLYLRHFPTVVPGTGDKVMYPYDVCMDGNGTLWVVGEEETAGHVVQYSTDGTAMTGFDLKESHYERGIAVNMRTNHILVTDGDQCAVQVFHPDGSLVRTVQHPEGEMTLPLFITVDGEWNLLVSDWNTHYVYVYDESGKFLFQFGGKGSREGQLDHPNGIYTDSSGHILVADDGNKRIQIFTRHGEFVRTFRTGSGPEGLAVGPEGQLVVTSWDHTVTVYPNY
ncbi:protein meiotic P26-like [Branchiostoma floridae x Branchiostoma japonicum]